MLENWLAVIIGLLIIGIVLHGFHRMRVASRSHIKLSKKVSKNDEAYDFEEPSQSSEFPSGGARVAGYRDDHEIDHTNDYLKQTFAASRHTAGSPANNPDRFDEAPPTSETYSDESFTAYDDVPDFHGKDVDLEVDEPVSMYVEEPEAQSVSQHHTPAPAEDFYSDDVDPLEPSIGNLEDLDGLDEPVPQPATVHEKPLPTARSVASKFKDEWLGKKSSSSTKTEKTKPEQAKTETSKKDQGEQEVIVMNVMAPEGMVFNGEMLLESLMAHGLRFGHMDIFHRHVRSNGTGEVLFSMANMIVPGTFNLSEMSSFESPGLSMFMTLPLESDSLSAFRLMTDTAKALAEDLGGELKDENRSVMTQQTIEHCRQRIMEFERRRRLHQVAEY